MTTTALNFDVSRLNRFESVTFISGIPLPSERPLNNQYLSYDASKRAFVYKTASGGGATGPTGDQGPTGLPGPAGKQGPVGDKGSTGLQGVQGQQGEVGATGSRGQTGTKGNTGTTGLPGDVGPRGQDGTTPWVRKADPTTGNNGVYYDIPTVSTNTNFVYGVSTEGAGTKLFYDAPNGSFRAGHVDGTQWNVASRGVRSVGIGLNTIASGDDSVSLGSGCSSLGQYSVAVNQSNSVSGLQNVACGLNNVVSADINSFACGRDNTVAGGGNNYAIGRDNHVTTGDGAYALGAHGTVSALGVFLFAAGATPITVNTPNTFNVKAPGGSNFYSNSITLASGVRLTPGATSWSMICDRRNKRDLIELDYDDVLNKLAHVKSFRYTLKDDASKQIRVGPTAQDWHAAFPNSGKHKCMIDMGDFRGALLAGIKAVAKKIDALYPTDQTLQPTFFAVKAGSKRSFDQAQLEEKFDDRTNCDLNDTDSNAGTLLRPPQSPSDTTNEVGTRKRKYVRRNKLQ